MPYASRQYKNARRRTGRRLQGGSTASTTSRYAPYVRTARAMYTGAAAGAKAAKAYRSYKRSRTDSSGESSSARPLQVTDVSMNDYKKASYSMGRRLSTTVRNRRLVQSTANVWKLSLRDFGAWNRGNGNEFLSAIQEGLAGTTVRMPLHLYDLTATPQAGSGGDGNRVYYPCCKFRLGFSSEDDSASVEWATVAGPNTVQVTSDAMSDANINKQDSYYPIATNKRGFRTGSSPDNADQTPGAKSFLESVYCKMLCYGPKQAPTKWMIQLVQLKDDVAPYQTTPLATAFWQALSKPYGYNPLDTGNQHLIRKNMKVIKSISFQQDCPESSEDHLSARMKQINLFAYLNRRLNYMWGTDPDLVNLDQADTFENANANTGRISTTVHPNARVYLMVRALTTYQGPEGIEGTNLSPSYDIQLDLTHKGLS